MTTPIDNLNTRLPYFVWFFVRGNLSCVCPTSVIVYWSPTIFITAKAQASDRRRFYQAGAKGLIIEPFDTLTLASQISGFLGWC